MAGAWARGLELGSGGHGGAEASRGRLRLLSDLPVRCGRARAVSNTSGSCATERIVRVAKTLPKRCQNPGRTGPRWANVGRAQPRHNARLPGIAADLLVGGRRGGLGRTVLASNSASKPTYSIWPRPHPPNFPTGTPLRALPAPSRGPLRFARCPREHARVRGSWHRVGTGTSPISARRSGVSRALR